ncbi:response regulator receiver protein [Stanieria cyanosphaera PCC 7437]|uniref:Response regulator receiver protein n=1 Tax=Stanieria cyanosphaera (strain ATCC 29371 / PCC 7437) TaxID=111780 RepID=K9XWG0_STAC7|nr:response regulator [Stanieria cyanosphaera]AFZ36930.1 response regulator receiver protein [Stanieria cyanosphaera PCC 7437]
MTSNLANTFQILKKASERQWSGCLVVSQPKDHSVNWQLYLNNGELQYATSATGQAERLSYLWQQFQPNLNLPELTLKNSEYQQVCNYLAQQNLPQSELQQFLLNCSQEALVHVLSFKQAEVELIANQLINDAITNFSWLDLATKAKQFILGWQEVLDYCDSPFNRIYLDHKSTFNFYKIWKKNAENSEQNHLINFGKLSTIVDLLLQKNSLYQLSLKLEIEPLHLIKLLQPFIKEKLIEILPWQEQTTKTVEKVAPDNANNSSQLNSIKIEPQINQKQPSEVATSQRQLIACIDDSNTVQKQVKMILESVGYDVIGITESANALRGLSRQQPVLILMDINMPDINGYDLCSMLRRSQKFQEIPIIMLTGRDGIIDRMRAKFVGATNYLTKPFQPDQLIALVQELSLPTTSI